MVGITITIYDPITKNTYTFTHNNFKSIKFSNQLFDTSFELNPTVIEQYATIVFKDKDGTISDMVVTGELRNDMEVRIHVDQNIDYTYLTSSWEVQASSTTVTLQCNDPVKRLENIQTQLISPRNMNLKELIDYGFQWSEYNYEFDSYDTKEMCENISLTLTYVTYMDLLTYFKKLCVVGFLRIYWRRNKFIVARCL